MSGTNNLLSLPLTASMSHFLTAAVRRFAAVAVVALSSFATCVAAEPGQAAPSNVTPAAVSTPAVELVKALAWPAVAILVAVIFRRAIAGFVSALGSRVTKLSLFKVELELVPASAATSTPLLDDIRTQTNPALISDSTRMMLDQVQSGAPADFALVALGTGNEWITSRLYIAAVMMERMRNVKVFVFVERAPTTERRFVAVASVKHLRWALARRYVWLEVALTRSLLSVFPPAYPSNAPQLPAGATWSHDPRTISLPQPVITSDTGALDPWQARQVVSSFIDSLQLPQPPPPQLPANEWVTVHGTVYERAAWVTRELLSSLLPQDAFRAWSNALRDSPRAHLTRAVLRRHSPFVALVEGEQEFVRLVNRQALVDEIAASLGEEPENDNR
jgi:hypothetical protein